MKKHLTICAAREGITYSFDNSQIINFQDNFKFLGDFPFAVYYDFETTTGDSVFFLSQNVCGELLSNLFISSIPKSRQDCYLLEFLTDS